MKNAPINEKRTRRETSRVNVLIVDDDSVESFIENDSTSLLFLFVCSINWQRESAMVSKTPDENIFVVIGCVSRSSEYVHFIDNDFIGDVVNLREMQLLDLNMECVLGT